MYIQVKKADLLLEDTRTMLVSKSRNAGQYQDQSRGKNRFERKKYSQVAKTVKQYNKIDMNRFWKEDILEVNIPVVGETDEYTVSVKMEGVVAELQRAVKNNHNKFEFKVVIQALTKIFNSANIYVKCTCKDFKYRFAHVLIVANVSTDDSSQDPGPGKGIANPNDDKGRGCKHILQVISNGAWLMKVASVIFQYALYMDEHNSAAFKKFIFPKIYGFHVEDAVEGDLLPEEALETDSSLITAVNEWAKNKGKFKKGSNVNPEYAKKLAKNLSKETNDKNTGKLETEEASETTD